MPVAALILCCLLAGSAWAQEAVPAALGDAPFRVLSSRGPFTRSVASSTAGVISTGPTIPSPNLNSREDSRLFYLGSYLDTDNAPMAWTGSLSGDPEDLESVSGTPGGISKNYQNTTQARVNWFRAMAGVPAEIVFDSGLSAKDQKAALMMTANTSLSHTPPSSWALYSSDAATAAANSNISLGWNGPDAVTAYMLDFGAGNTAAGHRRWLLYPQTRTMGNGDIPWVGNFYSANALWVIDDNLDGPRPVTRDGYVAWPPPGFVPSPVVFPRWSFSYPDADFSGATVSMSLNGNSVPVSVEPKDNPGYGENTVVWVWKNIDATKVHAPAPPPAQDEPYLVQVNNVKVAGKIRNFTYTVTVFDPQVGEAHFQPDLAIADWGKTNWSGKGSYQSAVNAQPLDQKLTTQKRGKYKLQLRNRGNRSDTFTVEGSAASPGFRVIYRDLGHDVTQAVIDGTYEIRLKPGSARTLMLKVLPDDSASSGATQNVTVSARSTNDGSKSDAVEATVTLP